MLFKRILATTLLLLTLQLSLFSQTDSSFRKSDSVYKAKIFKFNNSLQIHSNLLRAQDEVDRLSDAASGKGRLLSNKNYSAFFDKYFTLLSFEKEGLPDGNSASLKTSSNDTKMNLNLSHKKAYTITNVGADLNLSSNTGSIFSGGDLTANSTYYIKASFLNSGFNKLWYDYDRRNEMLIKRNYRVNEIRQEYNANFVIKYTAIALQLKNADSIIAALYDKKMAGSFSEDDKVLLIKTIEEKAKYKKALADAGLEGNIEEKIEAVKTQLDKEIYEIELSSNAWTAFRIGWFSGSVSYTKDKYITYDKNSLFEKKVGERLFDKWSLNASYNFLFERNSWWQQKIHPRGLRSIYLSASWTGSKDNNFSQIKETDFTTRQIFIRNTIASGDSSLEVVSTQKVKDITGKTFQTEWNNSLGIQSTLIFGKSNFWGVNLSTTGTFSRFRGPLFNGKAGILFRFIDSNDGKSKVNFEVFMQLRDWADNLRTNKTTWERKVIGISTTVPFNRVFFK
ncbi:hypothetical protein WG954_12130 [Lacibacter sp. H375]|uniref:hypothetical protein n=1 Tax=Lacibacter sp. H375 TaxID=3133424 RepID=UPI0030BC8EDB